MARSSSGFAGQAARNALLKYAPQREALQEALQTAQQTYGSTVKASRANARLTKGAINEAIPATRDIYKRADAAQQPGVTLLSSLLGNLHGVSDAQKGGNAAEVQQQLANLISQRAGAESRLQREGVAAQAGAQFAESSARGSLQNTIANLVSKNGRLSAQQGAAASAEADNLANQALDREQRENASIRSTGQKETASERAATAKGAAAATKAAKTGAVKWLTQTQHNAAKDKIQTLRQYIGSLRFHNHLTYAQAYDRILKGSPAIKNGTEVIEPARKPEADNGLTRAAADLAYFGGVGEGTVGRLHGERYAIKELGYPVYRPKK